MERLSEIIHRLYHKYLPRLQAAGVTFNLDFPDTTLTVTEKARVERDLEKSIKSAIARTKSGTINIIVRPGRIVVYDTGTVLSKSALKLLNTEHVEVKSRVGFGTTVTIK